MLSLVGWTSGPQVTRAQREQDSGAPRAGGCPELQTDTNLSFSLSFESLTEKLLLLYLVEFYLDIIVQKITIKYVLKRKYKFAHHVLQKVISYPKAQRGIESSLSIHFHRLESIS